MGPEGSETLQLWRSSTAWDLQPKDTIKTRRSKSQLPGTFQRPLAINKHAPALIAPPAVPANHGLEGPLSAGELHDLAVKGARLHPHGGDAQLLGLLEDLEGGGRRGDDGYRGLFGVGEGRQVREGGELLQGRDGC